MAAKGVSEKEDIRIMGIDMLFTFDPMANVMSLST